MRFAATLAVPISLGLALGLLPTGASALVVRYDDRDAFLAAAGAVEMETFEGVLADDNIRANDVYGGPSGGADLTDFSVYSFANASLPPDWNKIDVAPYGSIYAAFGSTSLTAFLVSDVGETDTLEFWFDAPVTAFGASFYGLNNVSPKLEVWAAGEILGLPVQPDNRFSFVGFVSDTTFTKLRFLAFASEGFGMDDLIYSVIGEVGTPAVEAPETGGGDTVVPLPAAAPLLALGLGALSLAARRRRSAA